MQKSGRLFLVFASMLLILTGCEQTPDDTGPGGVSKDDARALDAAAEKLDSDLQLPVIQAPPPEAVADKTKAAKK